MTSIPRGADRAKPIEASSNNVAFLGIHFDNDFADEVPDELRRQCPNGKVTGVYAKYETKWYVLVENRSVTAKAYCVPGEVAENPARVPAAPPSFRPPSSPSPSFPAPSSPSGPTLPGTPAGSTPGSAPVTPAASLAPQRLGVGS